MRWFLAAAVILTMTAVKFVGVAYAEEEKSPEHLVSITIYGAKDSKTFLVPQSHFRITPQGCLLLHAQGHEFMHCGNFTVELLGEIKEN